MQKSWRELAILSASLLMTLLAVDYSFQFLFPSAQLREVDDGVRDLRRGNPTVLVVGSSHARTFHVVGLELARRTGSAEQMVAVPLENGKLFAYDALLQRWLLPIIDRRNASGTPVKNRLKRFVLLTEWWDSCSHGDEKSHWNLPARAWEFRDFVNDLARNGMNGYNRNYLQNRFRVMFRESALIRDRSQRLLLPNLARLLQGKPINLAPDEELRRINQWQRMVERGAACIGDPVQMASLDSILEIARARQWETAVILFPRKPATLTSKAKATTLATFASQVHAAAKRTGATVIDLTDRSPLTDADFMDDFDHVSLEGNRKFASWVLDHDLNFLLGPAPEPRHAGSER